MYRYLEYQLNDIDVKDNQFFLVKMYYIFISITNLKQNYNMVGIPYYLIQYINYEKNFNYLAHILK